MKSPDPKAPAISCQGSRGTEGGAWAGPLDSHWNPQVAADRQQELIDAAGVRIASKAVRDGAGMAARET